MKKDVHPGGRPRKEIDFDELDRLCHLQCTQAEICSVFDIDTDTLALRIREKSGLSFPEYFELKRGHGKLALRRAQFRTAIGSPAVISDDGQVVEPAINPNPTMQIWLGKQLLDQSDKQEIVNHEGLKYAEMDPEARRKRIEELLAKRSS